MKTKLEDIKRVVENEVGHRIDTRSKRREHTYARAVYCKVARELSEEGNNPSLQLIGEVINRDHASVRHNIMVIFPFSQKETSYRQLYETLTLMFSGDPKKVNEIRRVKRLSKRIIELDRHNESLTYKLSILQREGDRFAKLTDGFSAEEMDEIYDKLEIMAKAIRSRVYR